MSVAYLCGKVAYLWEIYSQIKQFDFRNKF